MSTSRQHNGDANVDKSHAATDAGSEQLRDLIAPVCVDSGFELVDLEFKRGAGGAVLRIFIDYPEGSEKSISFEECTALSREVSALLDVEDPIASRYDLEVSSPGVDRPLRTPAHFRRFVGSEVKVQLREGQEGRRNFKGMLVSIADDDSSISVDVDGTHFDLPLADLSSAKLVPDWNALMKGQGKRA